MTRRTKASAVALIVLAASVLPWPAAGQDLAERVASAPDGWIRFTFAAREGVCGNGRWISTDGDQERRRSDSRHWVCDEGPVRIELSIRAGEPRELDTEVGGDWATRSGAVTDLGDIAPQDAVDFLLHVAETAREDVAEDAIFPATLARGVETWPRLLEIARGGAHTEVRGQAVFWLGQEASDRATEGLTSIIEDEGELEVREQAIFALSQRRESTALDALMRIARSHPEPEVRRKAIFWLGQRGDDPRVLELLEEILTDGG